MFRANLLFVGFLAAAMMVPLRVVAADQTLPLNLTISPVTLQLNTTPGVSTESPVKIRNNATEAETLHVSILTFTPDSSGEKPILRDPSVQDEFMKWFSVSEDRFVVQPGEWKSLTVTFSPPETAALTYAYAIVIGRDNVKPVEGSTVISGSAALMVLANVESPNTIRELSVTKFVLPHIVTEFLPIQFETTIKNMGNTFVIPHGNIFIDGQGKKDLAVLSLNPNALAALPDTSRVLRVAWQDGFPVYQDTTGKSTLLWDWNTVSHLRIGRYTAHLLLVYDNGSQDVPIESSVTFWVIPLRLILGAIAVPTVPALIVFVLMKLQLRKASLLKKEEVL